MFFFISFGCTTHSPNKDTTSDSMNLNTAIDCSDELPVLPWTDNAVPTEGLEGIEQELEEIDISQLEDPVDISNIIPLYRGAIAYALEITPSELPSSLTHQEILAKGKLGEVVIGAFILGQQDITGFDFTFFRRGFHRYYTCSREFPRTLDDFQSEYGTYNSETGVVVASIAKCNDRRLISQHEGIYIAESLVEGMVRETEILLENHRNDGQLEFLVYDADGQLTNRTQFPTIGNGPHVVTSSPYACMTCHMNPDADDDTWGYNLLMPETGPCR